LAKRCLISVGGMKVYEGQLVVPEGARIAIVAARFNDLIVDRLIAGAVDAFQRHGGDDDNLSLVRVPGAWEVPLATARLCDSGQFDGVVALAAVIRGSTPHFDYVAAEVSKGVAHASMDAGVPVSFGVLTTESIEQAIERAGTKAGNKGADAMLAVIEMASLGRVLDAHVNMESMGDWEEPEAPAGKNTKTTTAKTTGSKAKAARAR
jgi:6,7-dimethyl-8-ribityllumazine synthase